MSMKGEGFSEKTKCSKKSATNLNISRQVLPPNRTHSDRIRFWGNVSSEFARFCGWEEGGGVVEDNSVEVEVSGRVLMSVIVSTKTRSISLSVQRQSACSSSGLTLSPKHHHDMRTTRVEIPVDPPYQTLSLLPGEQISAHHSWIWWPRDSTSIL